MRVVHHFVHEGVFLRCQGFVFVDQNGLRYLVSELLFYCLVEFFEVFGELHQDLDTITQEQRRFGSNEYGRCPSPLPVNDTGYSGLVVDIYVTSMKVGVPNSRRDKF
jgi:hypothetical protein